jgi:glycosyltransferase involved in cell wall biosynthesis
VRVALVHDWLTGMRGGERCLHEFARLWPEADLYTLFHVPGSTSETIERRRIEASPLSRLPGAAHHYRKLLPLFPWAIERFRLEGYDLVLSSSHAVAKGIRAPAGATHVCYCFTPMRYVWDQADAYLGRGLRRALGSPLAAYLRRWDRRTSGPERVQRFVAISHTVAERIKRHYGRESDVVYPPVDVARFSVRPEGPDDFYLLVGGFVPYKREDIAIEAFARLGRPLWVAGDGPGRAALEAHAPANVRFLGRVDDVELAGLYARCRALIYPQDEDFGIVPVEAQAAGRPVVAYGRGGATETVVPLGRTETGERTPTGVWFDRQDPESLAEAVRRFEADEHAFDPAAIRTHAEWFRNERFHDEIREVVASSLAERAESRAIC